MAFPQNWAQVWVRLPMPFDRRHVSTLCWFTWEPWIDLAGPALDDCVFALQAWADLGPWWLCGCDQPGGLELRCYFNCPTLGIVARSTTMSSALFRDPCLPASSSVVIRRYTSNLTRTGRGRMYLPYPKLLYTNGPLLDPIARASFQSQANNMLGTASFFGSPVFQPVLVSYKDGTALPILSVDVQTRLGQIKRRRRPRNGRLYPTFPKLPPP